MSAVDQPPWLVVIDMQNVFGEPSSPWFVPRFEEALDKVERLVAAFAPRVVFTRFVAPETPTGAWVHYYRQWPFALQPPSAELYQLVPRLAPLARGGTVDAPTFSKWLPEIEHTVGTDGQMVLAGVATDACVIGTALAAADAGVRVHLVADACAGVDDDAHDHALAVMRLASPLVEVVDSAGVTALAPA